jgi:F-type H+-transporting ATPase subunit b
MLIDWFTVGAQALNFLILVWLLKHYLYKPILDAIDAREKRIAAELTDAAALKAAAKKEQDEFQSKNRALDGERSALLSKATDEAKAMRERLLTDAHRDADSLRVQEDKARRNDQMNLRLEITRLAAQEVFGIARNALKDLATASLEERMTEVFTRRLREMDAKTKESLATALKASTEPAMVRSAFEMPVEERDSIQNALNETFSAEIRVRFDTASNIVSGIELTAGGQKLAWSIAEYLAEFERKLGQLLEPQAIPAPQTVSAMKASATAVA